MCSRSRRLLRLHGHISPAGAARVASAPTPFTLRISDEELTDLQQRLKNTRFPDQLQDLETGWEYGASLAYMQEVITYWRNEFDWRTAEKKFNAIGPQFTLPVNGLKIHFIHKRSSNPKAKPLIITHGWPGSVWEFNKILPMLTEPQLYGGAADQAFHVVAPSIPGYGFSQAPAERGADNEHTAHTFHALMLTLGYPRYFAQGGDWGARVTRALGVLYPLHCVAIHLNMLVAGPPEGFDTKTLTPDEMADVMDLASLQKYGTGYQQIQGTKPQTLGYGLTDSPAGLAAWILEKYAAWSDCREDKTKPAAVPSSISGYSGALSNAHTLDDLLTNICIYWFSGNVTSTTRYYYENMALAPGMETAKWSSEFCSVPTGCIRFPYELYKAPKSWLEASHNLRHYTWETEGGHFAAMEKPDLLVRDMRKFFFTAI